MFTAIVLNPHCAFALWQHALHLDLLVAGWKEHCHHVTLAMGTQEGYSIGEGRTLTVTHYGAIAGRVTAFRVSGATDSRNDVPHVTIATNQDAGAKPKESNSIVEWIPLEHPFTVTGTVELCKGA